MAPRPLKSKGLAGKKARHAKMWDNIPACLPSIPAGVRVPVDSRPGTRRLLYTPTIPPQVGHCATEVGQPRHEPLPGGAGSAAQLLPLQGIASPSRRSPRAATAPVGRPAA